MSLLFSFFVLGGMDGNQEFGFKHGECEMFFRHPGENVQQAVGHTGLELEKVCRLKIEMWVSSMQGP